MDAGVLGAGAGSTIRDYEIAGIGHRVHRVRCARRTRPALPESGERDRVSKGLPPLFAFYA
jgi:hypothetical protein